MNFVERFKNCRDFLSPWSEFLKIEALKRYPAHCEGVLKEWCESLSRLRTEELLAFQNDFDPNYVDSDSLKELVLTIKRLTSFKTQEVPSRELPSRLLRNVSPKKKHEIDSLLHFTDDLGKVENILDIGGGVGHLSSALVYERDRKSYSIDANDKFQASGASRIKRWAPELLPKIKFVNRSFDERFALKEFDESKNRLVVGLHSCGKLGTDLIKEGLAKKYEHMILASCCYHKLEGAYNLSSEARTRGIKFSDNSLHLASRCYRYESLNELRDKIELRKYRYALHLLNYEYGKTEFESIGNTKAKDYKSSFSDYVKKYSALTEHSRKKAQSFYLASSTQKKAQEIIMVDIIRALFGRVIEAYLILDRALYLEEAGFKAEIIEGFDRKLSPRNLIVIGSKINDN